MKRHLVSVLLLVLLCSTACVPTDGIHESKPPGTALDDDDAELKAEVAHFLEWDKDGDGQLNQGEFHAMMKHVVDSDRAEEDDESNTKLHSTDVEFAMKEFDADGDGAVSVEEYIAMVFHEAPQMPMYHGSDEDLEEGDEKADMGRVFREWDLDRDGMMNEAEVKEMFKAADRHEGGASLEDDHVGMLLWHLMDDKDKDKDGKLSLEEFVSGGGY